MRKRLFVLGMMFFLLFLVDVKALQLEHFKDSVVDEAGSLDDVFITYSYDSALNNDGYYLMSTQGVTKYDLALNRIYLKSNDDINDLSYNMETTVVDKTVNTSVKGNTDLLVVLKGINDKIIFEKLFGGNGDEGDVFSFPTFNNDGDLDGYVIHLATTSNDLNGVKAGYLVIKYDLDGNLLWQHNDIYNDIFVYDNMGNIESLFIKNGDNISRKRVEGFVDLWSVPKVPYNVFYRTSYNKLGNADGLIMTGVYIYSMGCEQGKIVKYDLDGNNVFETKSDSCGNDYYSVVNFKNEKGIIDGYLVSGTIQNSKAGLFRYDLDGNLIEKISNDSITSYYYAMESFNENNKFNGYVVLGKDANNKTFISKYIYPSFEIKTDFSDFGTINVDKDAIPGTLVSVSVVVKEGYSLDRIIVKNESGEEIKVNSDGTFIMPEGKITVSAIYKRVTNPDTVSAAYMVLGIVLLIAVGSLIVIRQNNKKND